MDLAEGKLSIFSFNPRKNPLNEQGIKIRGTILQDLLVS